jgi:hypothetical protein
VESLLSPPLGETVLQWVSSEKEILLDVDLDCFTTPCDVDPTTPLGWSSELIERFLRPDDSEEFWNLVLTRTRAVTLAREPAHCGGVVAGGTLFQRFAEVFFVGLLGADLP